MPAAHLCDPPGRAGHLARHPPDRRDQLVTVSWSWLATASARIVESTAPRRRPLISETLAEIYRLEVQRYFPTRHLRG
jgi:hypothetical protein